MLTPQLLTPSYEIASGSRPGPARRASDGLPHRQQNRGKAKVIYVLKGLVSGCAELEKEREQPCDEADQVALGTMTLGWASVREWRLSRRPFWFSRLRRSRQRVLGGSG
jgi:hypothetical protein